MALLAIRRVSRPADSPGGDNGLMHPCQWSLKAETESRPWPGATDTALIITELQPLKRRLFCEQRIWAAREFLCDREKRIPVFV